MILHVVVELNVLSRDEANAVEMQLRADLSQRYFHRNPYIKTSLRDDGEQERKTAAGS